MNEVDFWLFLCFFIHFSMNFCLVPLSIYQISMFMLFGDLKLKNITIRYLNKSLNWWTSLEKADFYIHWIKEAGNKSIIKILELFKDLEVFVTEIRIWLKFKNLSQAEVQSGFSPKPGIARPGPSLNLINTFACNLSRFQSTWKLMLQILLFLQIKKFSFL